MRRIILALFIIGVLGVISCGDDDLTEPCDAYISGNIYFPDSTVAGNVTVRLIQEDISTTTNQYGRYSLERPDIDTCTIVVSYEGYQFDYVLIDPHQIGCSQIDFYLEELPNCPPKNQLPPDYPLGVYFYIPYFMDHKRETVIGDSLWISAYEWFQPPPSIECYTPNDVTHEVLIFSSLGDSEIKDYDELRPGIPEIWSFAYIIDTQASSIPYPNNGIVEVEPSGGNVYAYYRSHWLDVYVCYPHKMIVAE
jgi:hypothetical protein